MFTCRSAGSVATIAPLPRWTGREHLWEQYVAACAEVSRFGSAVPACIERRRGPATSVFFGGGTPSLLPAELVLAVLEAVSDRVGLASGAEVTVECNPETVTGDKLSAYRAGGVTRLSFGVQSMVPHVLAALGRQHEPASVRRAAYLAGEAGFAGAYNTDLIFGAAGETMGDWEASLAGVLALDPPPAHVSAYALTVEPGTPLATQRDRHPCEDDQADKYAMACSWLSGAGFGWYENLELGTAWCSLRPQSSLLVTGRILGRGLFSSLALGAARRQRSALVERAYTGALLPPCRGGRAGRSGRRDAGRRAACVGGAGPQPADFTRRAGGCRSRRAVRRGARGAA